MKRIFIFTLVVVSLALVLAACQPEAEQVEVTRVVTETEQVEVTRVVEEIVESEVEVTRIVEQVVEVEVPAEAVEKTVIDFWSTDTEAPRVELYEELIARYMAENPDVEVRLLPIQEAEVSQRISTAQGANRLPDIIRMGIERVAAFSAEGILDQDAAQAVIAALAKMTSVLALWLWSPTRPLAITRPCPLMAGFKLSGTVKMSLKKRA